MRFQVPQFTEIEDKIFGPLTLKQFIYLAGGAGALVLFYGLLPLVLAILFGIPIALFSLALAFYKVHNQPFIKVAENAIKYALSSQLYLWKRKEIKLLPKAVQEKKEITEIFTPKLTKSRLSDLAWSLDIKEKLER